MPENPLRGRFVFEQKGCLNCHAIQGEGGTTGPDLGQRRFFGSFLELAGVFWNHAPEMLRRMRQLDLPYPEFTRGETNDLIAFLYYLPYLGEPGDLYRGRLLAREKGCLNCHSVGGKGERLAPAFDRLGSYVSPLYMAQTLWNHGPQMSRAIEERGLSRPTFQKGEIVDLAAYIRSASRVAAGPRRYLSPGNPARGEQVLESKHCLECHSLRGRGGDLGVDFAQVEWNRSVTEIAGLMWNHGGEMEGMMDRLGIAWPRFSGAEMADLIAFLYFLGFNDLPGDADAGARLFARKGCAGCHGDADHRPREGPDLARSGPITTPADMTRILWNHAPVMEARISAKVISWPKFEGTDMANLYAYLQAVTAEHGGRD